MAGQFDRIVEELYNKVALNKGYCDELLSEEGLEYFKKLIESYEKPEIIETYQNGSSWYRVYRDGWCEQGGSTYGQTLATNNTVSLLKPFKDTNYTLSLCFRQSENATGGYSVGYDIKTVNSFVARGTTTAATVANSFDWLACGYIS